MVSSQAWDDEYDVIVIGSGSGLAAALTAADLGLSALVVEKTEYLGGSTAMSAGAIWAPGNSVLRESGVADSRARAAQYLDELVGDSAPRARRVSYLEHGPAAIDMLRRRTPLRFVHAENYSDYHSEVDGASAYGRAIEPRPFDLRQMGEHFGHLRPSAVDMPVPMPITSRDYKRLNLTMKKPVQGISSAMLRAAQGVGGLAIGRHYAALGRGLVGGMIAGLRTAGIPIWRNAAVRELVIDGGRADGVIVERDGQSRRIWARKAVVIAAGGFERNIEMRHKYQSTVLEDGWSLASPGNTGDLIELAHAAGAELTLMDQAWWFPAIASADHKPPQMLLTERSLPGSLIVDGTGHRFVNESTDYMRAGRTLLGLADGVQPHLPAWLLFDQRYRNSYIFGGELMPRQPLPRAWYDAGIAYKADSIQKLAEAVGIPGIPDGVERFNLLAAQGHDDDFFRGLSQYDHCYGDPTNTPNPNLRPLTKPPFYAVRVVPGDLGTCGGILADEFARALRPDGSDIKKLYAVGNSAGNAFGDKYPGPGATIGLGIAFGYIASMHAAGQLPPNS